VKSLLGLQICCTICRLSLSSVECIRRREWIWVGMIVIDGDGVGDGSTLYWDGMAWDGKNFFGMRREWG